ncbi:MAG: hypothetical protein QXN55_03445 [Candidatus Nitrosotenuis sp.]
MQNVLFLAILIPLILIPVTTYAETDFAFKQFSNSLSDVQTTIAFGKKTLQYDEFWTPHQKYDLEFAKIKLADSEFYLADPEVKIFNDSFLITSKEDGIQIYSYLQNNQRIIRTVIFDDDIQVFEGHAKTIDTPQVTENGFAGILSKPKSRPLTELALVYKQDERNYWNDNYDLYVKIFDKSINPNPKFDDFQGIIKDATITVNIEDLNGKIIEVTGTSDFGLWHGSKSLPENIFFPGKYKVMINADYKDSKIAQESEIFLFSTAANRVASSTSQ